MRRVLIRISVAIVGIAMMFKMLVAMSNQSGKENCGCQITHAIIEPAQRLDIAADAIVHCLVQYRVGGIDQHRPSEEPLVAEIIA
jgi:hypothetical protein